MDLTCVDDMNAGSSLLDSLRECGNVLTTVWTYENGDDGALDSFQADELLRKKKRISYVRKRRDVYKNLGPGSAADSATVLAFGSLFSAPYKGSESHVDIRKVKKSEFLPFVPEILNAGKKFALDKIKDPFVCVQLRLLDGQFKNHWKATFQGVRQKLESLNQGDAQPINIFVMTDLPRANWSRKEDGLVLQTARQLATKASKGQHCPHQKLPDILLDIEESVCSCASLGFVGTAGSTIAESIQLMRKSDVCSILNRTAR
ncbi:O-fucosyltransferase 30 [Linum perenne]